MTATCELCGEPMPAGEEMFTMHGCSGPCPKPPIAPTDPCPQPVRVATDELIAELMTRFEHAVFSAMLPNGAERFEFRGNYIVAQGLGLSIAARVADARRKAEAEAQCGSP